MILVVNERLVLCFIDFGMETYENYHKFSPNIFFLYYQMKLAVFGRKLAVVGRKFKI